MTTIQARAYEPARERAPPRTVLDVVKPAVSMAVSGYVLHVADVPRVMLYSRKLNDTFLYASYALFGVFACLGIWLTWVVGRTDETWKTGDSHQRQIEVAAVSVTLGSVCWMIGVWPVFHLWVFPLSFVCLVFFLNVAVLLPNAPKTKRA